MDREGELTRQTTRQHLISLLSVREHTALELSAALRIREKEVYEHLDHVRRSIVSRRQRFHIRAAECLECHYVFHDRRRLTTPGRCPRCRGEHIQEAKYRVEEVLSAARKGNER